MKFMNGKKAKAIRKLSDVLLLDWLNRNLPEGSENVPIQNIRDYLPKDKYFMDNNNSRRSNYYTYKLAIKKLKKYSKANELSRFLLIETL